MMSDEIRAYLDSKDIVKIKNKAIRFLVNSDFCDLKCDYLIENLENELYCEKFNQVLEIKGSYVFRCQNCLDFEKNI